MRGWYAFSEQNSSAFGLIWMSGYLLYHLQSQLMAQKFDRDSGKVSGDAIPVASTVEYDASTWHTTLAMSQNGLMAYEPGSKSHGVQLIWTDRTGKMLGKVADGGGFKGSGKISPDGKKLAISEGVPQNDITVLDLNTGTKTRLTFGGATHLMPAWSPDGKNVVYVKQTGRRWWQAPQFACGRRMAAAKRR